MINYTVIIPHKNSVDLLQYCLDSITIRDDVQVIVVDDNSDANKVDFAHFPQWNGNNYECYLTKEGKGAGYCRNVGLEHAKGKWVLFVDADDYVLSSISDIFDSCVDSDADVIYFRPTAVMLSDRKTPSKRDAYYNKLIDEYQSSTDENDIRTLFFSPCSKFVKKQLIDEYGIRFDEIRYSNDNFFSVSVGCFAKKIEVRDDSYYVISQGDNSLTSNFLNKPGEFVCRAEAFYRSMNLVMQRNFRIDESTALLYLKMSYRNKSYYLYSIYFHLLQRYLKCSRIHLLNLIFCDYSRKHKILCYFYSEVIIRYYELKDFLRNSSL